MGMRGFLYSVILLLLTVPVVFFAANYFAVASSMDAETAIGLRGNEFASFVNSVSSDLPRALTISGSNALAATVSRVTANGSPLDDAKARLEELALNGTLYGAPLLLNSSLSHWAQRVQQIGYSRGFETLVTIESIDARPLDSFHLAFSVNASVNATDRVAQMTVHRRHSPTILVSIQGFEDPLYLMKTNGIVHRTVVEANRTVSGVSGIDWAVANKVYMGASDGASFLDRLENSTQASQKYRALSSQDIGLETFVNVQELLDNGLEIKQNKTDVDHLYFNETTPAGYALNGSQYPLFRIDAGHAALYGANGSLAG